MLSLLIEKELKSIVTSPKFVATFAICSVLILLSIYIGVNEYKSAVSQYESAKELTQQEISEQSTWYSLYSRAIRKPEPMQIFVSGLAYDIGRKTIVSEHDPVNFVHSTYSDDPIFALFRIVDFSFIVSVVLTLFAILFTFDSISGERERGTLKQIFSNPVPRAKYVLAKCIGSWLGLVVPILVPILVGVLLLIVLGIDLSGGDWSRLFALMGVSLLLFTFFIVLGVLISASTRRSNMSFLVSLVMWILFVLIIPRAGILLAGQVMPVPGLAEVEGRTEAYSKDKWAAHYDKMEKIWLERSTQKEEGEEFTDEELWSHIEEDDARRDSVENDIERYRADQIADLRRRQAMQRKLAFTLGRISPVSAYQLVAMQLAETDVDMKDRYEDATGQYRDDFVGFVKAKQEEQGVSSGMTISISTEGGIKIGRPSEGESIDLSEMPEFVPPKRSFASVFGSVATDFGLLSILTIAAFAGAFVRFVRYDVR